MVPDDGPLARRRGRVICFTPNVLKVGEWGKIESGLSIIRNFFDKLSQLSFGSNYHTSFFNTNNYLVEYRIRTFACHA